MTPTPSLGTPPARSAAALAYDDATGRSVLYGGLGSGLGGARVLYDTWLWDGSKWTASTASDGPQLDHPWMTYDVQRRQVLLVGTKKAPASEQVDLPLETWAWDGTWHNVPAGSLAQVGPGYQLAYDTLAHRVVMSVDVVDQGRSLTEVVQWTGNGWTVVMTQNNSDVATFVPMRISQGPGGLLGFGSRGNDAIVSVLDGERWRPIASTGDILPVASGGAFDPVHHVLVAFGGADKRGNGLDATVIFDGAIFHTLHPQRVPPARGGEAMTFDTRHGNVLMFGGLMVRDGDVEHGIQFADTWVWDGENWMQVGR